jgi:hypothetical protein
MNEVEILKQRVEHLEGVINQFVFSSGYRFEKDIMTTRGGRIGFFGVTPILQPSSTGELGGHFTIGGTPVNDNDLWGGNVGTTHYSFQDIVKHLKNVGILKM